MNSKLEEGVLHEDLKKIKTVEEINKEARLACIEEQKTLIECFKNAKYYSSCDVENQNFWNCFKKNGGVYRNKFKELFGPY